MTEPLAVSLPKGKSFSPAQNERLRSLALDLRGEDTTTALAKRLGVTQAGLSSFLTGRTGAGVQLASAIAAECGMTLDEAAGMPGGGVAARLPPDLESALLDHPERWDEVRALLRGKP